MPVLTKIAALLFLQIILKIHYVAQELDSKHNAKDDEKQVKSLCWLRSPV